MVDEVENIDENNNKVIKKRAPRKVVLKVILHPQIIEKFNETFELLSNDIRVNPTGDLTREGAAARLIMEGIAVVEKTYLNPSYNACKEVADVAVATDTSK